MNLMRFAIFPILFILFSQSTFALNDASVVNGYKYFLIRKNDNVDPEAKGVSNILQRELIVSGYEVVTDDEDLWPEELQSNPCLLLSVIYWSEQQGFENPKIWTGLTNCRGDTVFSDKSRGRGETTQDAYFDAASRSIIKIKKLKYQFDPSLAIDYNPEDEKSENSLSEELKEYFNSSDRHVIEGFYASTIEENEYRFYLKKEGNEFILRILKSQNPLFIQKETKATLRPKSIGSLFDIAWLDERKQKMEADGFFENGNLVLELDDSGEDIQRVIELKKKEL
jgi:hypothetical protein